MTTSVQHFRHDYIQPPFAEATAIDAMHPGVVACEPGTSVRDAARAMTDRGTHALVVEGISGDHLVWRVFTDMDLVAAARAGQFSRAVGDLATAEAATVDPGTPLSEVAGLMADHRVAHVIVVHGGRPAGVVSSADIARSIAWSHD